MNLGWGAVILGLGSIGIYLSARRDLKSAEQYPDRWNVPLQRRIVQVTKCGAIVVCAAAIAILIWSVLARA